MATQIQTAASAVLEELSFENLGAEMPGAPMRFRPNAETIELIKSLVDDGKKVVVDSTGDLSFD